MGWRGVLDAAADLAWGGSCAGCGRPGPVCCPACAGTVRALVPRPVPAGDGRAPTWARGDYAGELRALILACKERQGLGLVPLLGDLLLGSAAAVVRDRWPGGPVLLVPVPSARATVAERGFDLTWLLARRTARGLARLGLDVRPRRALVLAGESRDQAGLGVADRTANRRRSMRALPVQAAQVVLVDDIVTTGATLTDAHRALGECGHRLLGAAVVAATPRLDGRR
ncbi:MAG TPA: phosphoribosyltransferase family protein [Micropruina sp.]|nr:ComF family protein [Micropruina sp.]NMD48044.1 ComF family protein [Propionibacterium sp.]HMQ37286.1 phosphoribosyltransferase family protein [Micropruina sp.]HMR21018.1 phosphoribosyltransferase family protein [Micropruina sp.]